MSKTVDYHLHVNNPMILDEFISKRIGERLKTENDPNFSKKEIYSFCNHYYFVRPSTSVMVSARENGIDVIPGYMFDTVENLEFHVYNPINVKSDNVLLYYNREKEFLINSILDFLLIDFNITVNVSNLLKKTRKNHLYEISLSDICKEVLNPENKNDHLDNTDSVQSVLVNYIDKIVSKISLKKLNMNSCLQELRGNEIYLNITDEILNLTRTQLDILKEHLSGFVYTVGVNSSRPLERSDLIISEFPSTMFLSRQGSGKLIY